MESMIVKVKDLYCKSTTHQAEYLLRVTQGLENVNDEAIPLHRSKRIKVSLRRRKAG